MRLSGTEKQRDDALEALVLQQEIAEELERERKRNKRELSALQHTNITIVRQRDEAQRVVLHLKSLISGQTHHMEHIVRSLNQTPDLTNAIEQGFDDEPEDAEDRFLASYESAREVKGAASMKEDASRSYSRASTFDGNGKSFEGEHVTPEMESQFFGSPMSEPEKRFSQSSITDAADRHLRDKTDAIADIIRNISNQCAAAVEGLQLAHEAEHGEDLIEGKKTMARRPAASEDGQEHSIRTDGSEIGEGVSDNGVEFLSPDGTGSSIPPTPDLMENRSSTSMSIVSSSTLPDRASGQYTQPDSAPKILEHGDEHERGSDLGQSDNASIAKQQGEDLARSLTARIIS